MKRFLTVYGMLSLCFISKAQTDFHFADSTAQWNVMVTTYYEGSGGSSSSIRTEVYHVEKDTVINSLDYQKIIPGFEGEAAFIRKDSTGKVFFYDTGAQGEKLIYDFGVETGDTIRLETDTLALGEIDTVLMVVDSTDMYPLDTVQNILRKRIFLHYLSGEDCSWSYEDIWIDGVGSRNSHFLNPYAYECDYVPGIAFNLLCFHENGTTYHFNASCFVEYDHISEVALSGAVNISPNPADAFLYIKLTEPSIRFDAIHLFNITGKEMLTVRSPEQTAVLDVQSLPSGIYFCRMTFDDGSVVVKKVMIE